MGVLQNTLTKINTQVTVCTDLTKDKLTTSSTAAKDQLDALVQALYDLLKDLLEKLQQNSIVDKTGKKLQDILKDLSNSQPSLWTEEKLKGMYQLLASTLQSFIDQLKSLKMPNVIVTITDNVNYLTAQTALKLQEIHCRILNLIMVAFKSIDDKLVSPVVYKIEDGVVVMKKTSDACVENVTERTNTAVTSINDKVVKPTVSCMDASVIQPLKSTVENVAVKTKSTAINTAVAAGVFVDNRVYSLDKVGEVVNNKIDFLTKNYIDKKMIETKLLLAESVDKDYFYGIGSSVAVVSKGVVDDVVTGYKAEKGTKTKAPGVTSKGAPVYKAVGPTTTMA